MGIFMSTEFLKEMSALDDHPPMVGVTIPDNEYFALPAVNNSTLKKMEFSPERFRYEIENPSDRSPAFELGSAIHMAILEPEKFASTYIIQPKFDRRTKIGKEASAAWEAENHGKSSITNDDLEIVKRISDRIKGNEEFAKYFSTGLRESVFTAKDPETGLWLKCKCDNYLPPDLNVIVDLKTTDCAARWVFNSDITRYKYYIQAAFYMDVVTLATGIRPDAFAIIAVEKTRNCDIAKFTFEECDLEIGRKEYRVWLNQLAECLQDDKWPGYDKGWNIWKPARFMIDAEF